MKSTRLEVFFYIEPDVPAYLSDSDGMVLDFEDWSGDEIIASSPHYFASERIVELMLDNAFTGFSSSEINTRLTEKFSVLSTFVSVPGFSLLNIEGRVKEIPRSLRLVDWLQESAWSGHDVCLGPKNELVFSQRCLRAIPIECLPNARIKTFGMFVSDLSVSWAQSGSTVKSSDGGNHWHYPHSF
jgi:hypothetical protein